MLSASAFSQLPGLRHTTSPSCFLIFEIGAVTVPQSWVAIPPAVNTQGALAHNSRSIKGHYQGL